jgi:large subunit ribosomal protein L7/L12
MSIVQTLADQIAALQPEEAKELRLHLKETLGIEAPGGSGGQPEEQPEKNEPVVPDITEFNLSMGTFDNAKKIGVIKVIREITGLSLGDAKTLVESPGKVFKESVDKQTALSIAAKLDEAGAKIEVKPA